MSGALRRLCRLLSVLVLLPGSAPLAAQDGALPDNPFAALESVVLPNGIRLWYGHLPGATVTSMAVLVPWGRDQDPPGQEQTAHLLEHVLLSDRAGRVEADLARELAGRGGQHNAFTGSSSMGFLLGIGTDQAEYGIHWLHGVIAPRQLTDAVVSRNRSPVAVEIQAYPRSGPVAAAWRLLTHPRLLPPPFWRREFGLDAQEERPADHSASLATLDAAGLQRFFDSYFAPPGMTLVIVSGAPRAALQPIIDETFGTIFWRPPPPPPAGPALRIGDVRRFTWHTGSTAHLSVGYRLAELDGRDQLRLLFIGDLLRHRLMERLRRGGDKSVYAVDVRVISRGQATLFRIAADVSHGQERATRDIIDEEIRRLLRAPFDSISFYADRDLLGRQLRTENASPAALRNWVADHFFRTDLHPAVPDVGEYYATLGADSIAAFAARALVPGNRIASVARPLPLPVWLLVLLGSLPVVAGGLLFRALTLRSADMSTVRFITRIRANPATAAIAAAALALVLLVAVRLLAAVIHIGADRWLVGVESFAIWLVGGGALLFAAALGTLALVGAVPHKILVFSHEVRLKSRTFRSVILPAAAIRSAVVVANAGGRRLRMPVLPFAGPAVFLELHDGSGYLLHVRDPGALARSVAAIIPACAVALPATAHSTPHALETAGTSPEIVR
jgi:predicted Zn-dependent peptidase